MSHFKPSPSASQPSGTAPGTGGACRRYAQDGDSLLLPFMDTPEIVHMGLKRLSAAKWLPACRRLPAYLHHKLRSRSALGERVYAAEPRSEVAQRELHQLLQGHLRRDHAGSYSASASQLCWHAGGARLCWPLQPGSEPLWQASQWVPDDLCILQEGPRGYELTAASLCAPSYWRLEEKIGRPLADIHGPVPGFAHKLGAQVERFFDHLLADFPVWRSNWSLVESPELLQRGGGLPGGVGNGSGGASPDGGLYLRVERQSLRRLPQTGAVVFSIRVMVNPLEDLAAVPGAPAALRRALEAMSPDEARYKSLAPLLPRLWSELAPTPGSGVRGDQGVQAGSGTS